MSSRDVYRIYLQIYFTDHALTYDTHILQVLLSSNHYVLTRYKSTCDVTDNGEELLHPFRVMSLFSGGTFDKNYNKRYQPIKFPVPASTKKVKHVTLIT